MKSQTKRRPGFKGFKGFKTSGAAGENLLLLAMLALLVVVFSIASPRFLTGANLGSMGFQMPLLGLLTLAMLMQSPPSAPRRSWWCLPWGPTRCMDRSSLQQWPKQGSTTATSLASHIGCSA